MILCSSSLDFGLGDDVALGRDDADERDLHAVLLDDDVWVEHPLAVFARVGVRADEGKRVLLHRVFQESRPHPEVGLSERNRVVA